MYDMTCLYYLLHIENGQSCMYVMCVYIQQILTVVNTAVSHLHNEKLARLKLLICMGNF